MYGGCAMFICPCERKNSSLAYTFLICGAHALALAEHVVAMATQSCVLMRVHVRGCMLLHCAACRARGKCAARQCTVCLVALRCQLTIN